jgi:aminomethyltransferase
LNKAIGLGYINAAFTTLDTIVHIQVRDKQLKAKVVKVPFI